MNLLFLKEYIGIIITALIGSIGTLFAFFTGKKKRESNANIEIGKAYMQLAEQAKESITAMRNEVSEIKEENIKQRSDMRLLQKEIGKLHRENIRLQRMLNNIEKENKILKLKLNK